MEPLLGRATRCVASQSRAAVEQRGGGGGQGQGKQEHCVAACPLPCAVGSASAATSLPVSPYPFSLLAKASALCSPLLLLLLLRSLSPLLSSVWWTLLSPLPSSLDACNIKKVLKVSLSLPVSFSIGSAPSVVFLTPYYMFYLLVFSTPIKRT